MIPPALPLPCAHAFAFGLVSHAARMVPTVAWTNLRQIASLATLAGTKAQVATLARKARMGARIYAGYPAARWFRELAAVLFCAARSVTS